MRILFVLHDFLPENRGGTELYTYNLAKAFMKRHEVRLFYNLPGDVKDSAVTTGVYDEIPFTSVNVTPNRFNDYAKKYDREYIESQYTDLLFSYKPDVVHFHHVLHLSPRIITITKEAGVPVVFTAHDYWLICNQITMTRPDGSLCDHTGRLRCLSCHNQDIKKGVTGIRKKAVNYSLKNIYWGVSERVRDVGYYSSARFREAQKIFASLDLVICPSDFMRGMLISNGFKLDNIITLGNGIVPVNSSRDKTSINPKLKFGYVGGASLKKGIHVLLEAFRDIETAELHIFGNVDCKEELLGNVDNPNIIFKGMVAGDEKDSLFSALDVFIVPSIWYENAPVIINEAYMYGAPVIASNIGGMKEMVPDGKTGLVFEVGDSDDLRRKIGYFIESPKRILKLRENISVVKTVNENVLELEHIYQGLIERTPG